MNINSAFPSPYLAAGVEIAQDTSLVMTEVHQEEVGRSRDRLPVLYFQGQKKGIVLNKTNARSIAGAYGDEMDAWTGRTVILYPTTTDWNGEQTACIRIKIPTLPSAAPNAQDVTNEHGTPPGMGPDGIPF